jgi:hypothetical protein
MDLRAFLRGFVCDHSPRDLSHRALDSLGFEVFFSTRVHSVLREILDSARDALFGVLDFLRFICP